MTINPAATAVIAVALLGLIGTLFGLLFTRVSHLEGRLDEAAKRLDESEDYSDRLWVWARKMLDLYFRHRAPGAPDPDEIPKREK